MTSLTSRAFWSAAVERTVRTGAQSAAAALIAAGTGLVDSDWIGVGSVAGMAAILSLLMSIGGNAATGHGPAIVGPEQVPPVEPRHALTPTDPE